MLDGLAIAIVVTKGWAKGYVYVLNSPFTCQAIAWSFARLAIASFYTAFCLLILWSQHWLLILLVDF